MRAWYGVITGLHNDGFFQTTSSSFSLPGPSLLEPFLDEFDHSGTCCVSPALALSKLSFKALVIATLSCVSNGVVDRLGYEQYGSIV